MSAQIYQFSSMRIQHNDIVKITDIKNITLSILGFLLSIAMIGVASVASIENDSVNMALLTVGGILFVFSLYLILNNRKKLVYRPTKSDLRHYICYVDSLSRMDVEKWIDGGMAASLMTFDVKSNGTLRLDAAVSADKKFIAVQLSEYEALRYEPYKIAYITGENVATVASIFS